jgi:hypothetical protein
MRMVGLVGYAPTTPAMSMQYSTIELQSHKYNLSLNFLIRSKYISFISNGIHNRQVYPKNS